MKIPGILPAGRHEFIIPLASLISHHLRRHSGNMRRRVCLCGIKVRHWPVWCFSRPCRTLGTRMQHLVLTGLLALFSLLPSVLYQNLWTVEWDATEFTSFSGDMIVPNLPAPGGTPYVWPGLQPGSTGVLQAVLDGRCVSASYTS